MLDTFVSVEAAVCEVFIMQSHSSSPLGKQSMSGEGPSAVERRGEGDGIEHG